MPFPLLVHRDVLDWPSLGSPSSFITDPPDLWLSRCFLDAHAEEAGELAKGSVRFRGALALFVRHMPRLVGGSVLAFPFREKPKVGLRNQVSGAFDLSSGKMTQPTQDEDLPLKRARPGGANQRLVVVGPGALAVRRTYLCLAPEIYLDSWWLRTLSP